MRTFYRRMVLVFAGLLAVPLAVECGLQIAGAVAHYNINKRLRGAGDDGRKIVAFVGDSNIYGAYVKENETLPCQIEVCSGPEGRRGLKCLNFGVPGSPSWIVLDQLKRALELKPAAIVVRTGINNTWLLPPESRFAWLDNIKLYRLARIYLFSPPAAGGGAANAAGIPEPKPGENSKFQLERVSRLGEKVTLDVERPSAGYMPFDDARPRLREDYNKMAELAESAGAKIIFATYLAGFEGAFQDVAVEMHQMAGVHGALVADCAAEANRILHLGGRLEGGLMEPDAYTARRAALLTRDRHPTAKGYELESHVVGAVLAELGLLQNDAVYYDPTTFILSLPPAPRLSAAVGKPGTLHLSGIAGDRPVVVFGTRGNSLMKDVILPLDWRDLKDHHALETVQQPSSKNGGEFDFQLSPAFVTRLPAPAFAVAVVERGGEFSAASIFISNTIEINE
ncbi:MAG: SGNH/GDSL hydrolase family protein [Planctomycetes bacterium]|nr:SGNH/GDSL hydrolase family protein [Planctomycetota bacterium]